MVGHFYLPDDGVFAAFRYCFQTLVEHQLQAGWQVHPVAPVNLHAFEAIAVMLAAGIFAGAMIHAGLPGSLDLGKKVILQRMSALTVAPEEGFHSVDFGFIKIDFQWDFLLYVDERDSIISASFLATAAENTRAGISRL